MITIDGAKGLLAQHLGDGIRARHSIFVGYLMRQLAGLLKEDNVLWEITGICHDLDFPIIGIFKGRVADNFPV